jgi:hypothetical protein
MKLDIERLAREAGLEVHPRKNQIRVGMDALMGIDSTEKVERFAALVLEKAAEVCDGVYHRNIGPGYGEVRYGIALCAASIRALKRNQNTDAQGR